jgi:hypothetical protein
MKKHLLLVLAALAAVSLLSIACGGDDDDKGSDSADSGARGADQAKPDEKKPDQSKSDPTKDAGKDNGGNLTGSGADALKQLAKKIDTKPYSVTYQIEFTDAEKKTQKGTLALSQKPPKSATVIHMTEGADPSFGGDIMLIEDDKFSYMCTDSPGTGKSCFKTKKDANNPFSGNFVSVDNLLKDIELKTNVTEVKSQTIAGSDSRCFKVKDAASEGTTCFAKDSGIMTLAEGFNTGSGSMSLKATKLTTNVDDKLFQPPADYTITELP